MKRVILGTIVLFLAAASGIAGPRHSFNHGLPEDWPFPAAWLPVAAAEGEEAPVITLEPLPQAVLNGTTGTFTAAASGTPPPVLQWQRSTDYGVTWTGLVDGNGFAGTDSEILQVNKVTLGMSGHRFRLTATNSVGGVASSAAALTVDTIGEGGGYVWLAQGGAGTERVGKIASDPAGSLCAAGTFSDPLKFGETRLVSNGGEDIFVLKLTGSGAVAWVKAFGGPGQDEGLGLAVDSQGNILVAGAFSETITIGATRLTSHGPRNVVVFKLDGSGKPLWAARAGGDSWAVAKGVAVDAAGNVVIAGEYLARNADFGATVFNNTRDVTDLFVAKLTAGGSFSWAVTAGGRDTLETLRSVQVDGAGSAYITGTFDQGFQPDEGADVVFGSDTLVSAGLDDVFVSKLNADGTFLWTRQIGGEGVERVGATATDAGGSSLLALYTDDRSLAVDDQVTTKPAGAVMFDSGGKLVALQNLSNDMDNVADLARGNGDNWLYAGTHDTTPPFSDVPTSAFVGGRILFPGVNQDGYLNNGNGLENRATAVASVPGGMYLGGTLGDRVSFGQKPGYGEGPCLIFARLNYPPGGAGPVNLRFVSARVVGESFRMVLINRVGAPLTTDDLSDMRFHTSKDLVNWALFTGKVSVVNGQIVLEEKLDAGAFGRYYRAVPPGKFQTVPNL